MTIRFTYNEVIALKPCQGGFRKANSLLANWKKQGYSLLEMYKRGVGYKDVLWILTETPKISDRVKALFSIDCAEHVLHLFEEMYPNGDTFRKALATARGYLDGRVTFSELESTIAEAYDTAWTARAGLASFTAVVAAWATYKATRAAAATADAAWTTDAAWTAARAVDADWGAADAAWIADAVGTAVRAVDDDWGADNATAPARILEQTWQMEHLEELLEAA